MEWGRGGDKFRVLCEVDGRDSDNNDRDSQPYYPQALLQAYRVDCQVPVTNQEGNNGSVM